MNREEIVRILEILIFIEFISRGISLLSDNFRQIMEMIFL